MNDELFGRIAFLLCREQGIESEAVGTILWELYTDYVDAKSGEWLND